MIEWRIVNAALYVGGSGQLFELAAADGKWLSIREQESYIDDAAAIPISRMHVDAGTDTKHIVDLEGRMLLPGFVDSHMHLDKAFTLPKVPNHSGTLLEAIGNYQQAIVSFSKAEIKGRIVRAAMQALSFGSTTLRSHLDFHLQAGREIAMRTIEAALEARELLKGWVEIQYFPMCPYNLLQDEHLDIAEETIRMGMDGIGGAPHLSPKADDDIDRLFKLAVRLDRPLDLHTDENDDPAIRTVGTIADLAMKYDYSGKVTVGHLCSLSSMSESDAEQMIDRMYRAQLRAVTLPAANLYLQGRADRGVVRRGVTRIKELLAAGVPLAAASDNIHDAFHPFGRGDMLQIALITGYAAHMGSPGDMRQLLLMITTAGAEAAGLSDYGLQAGCKADFVVLDVRSPEEAFTLLPASRWVVKEGRLVFSSQLRQCWNVPLLNEIWNSAATAD